jgi:hypothetical protein
MFIRVFDPKDRRELLLNVDHIIKIEVEYAVEDANGKPWSITPQEGVENPAAKRWYRFEVGGEKFLFDSDPNDPVKSVLEGIYRSAVKG